MESDLAKIYLYFPKIFRQIERGSYINNLEQGFNR